MGKEVLQEARDNPASYPRVDAETSALVERLGNEAATLLLCASDMDAKPWPPMMTEFVSALSVERKHVAACLSEAAAEIARLEAECFRLSAGCCINPGQHGLMLGEGGNPYCSAYDALQEEEGKLTDALAENARLTAERDEARARAERAERALRPFGCLKVPSKPQGNAGFYSLRFCDIEAARAALTPQGEGK